jgi:hypothetical protein
MSTADHYIWYVSYRSNITPKRDGERRSVRATRKFKDESEARQFACARRSMATRVSGSRRPPFPVDDDHLFRSMATRATGLWTGVMNAVG